MAHLPASKARQGFAATINRAAHGKERVVVRRRGKEIAAVVPIDDLRLPIGGIGRSDRSCRCPGSTSGNENTKARL